jgi:3'-phosphoadenosine 5'-phosphosulfate sulfotransferase (PAPS reductase)/FAD synthetase
MNLQELIDAGYIFYCSHSGGKDSQAMYAYLMDRVPSDQIVVVHADLGEVEWTGVQDHINDTIKHPLNVVQAVKTFFDMVERRGMFPSSAHRQCTSDLKRGPIEKFIRADLKARGSLLGVNCMGIRALESSARSKKNPYKLNKKLSKAGRTVYDWMPIFDMTVAEVFQTIENAGQEPFWAYKENTRLSCVFCIMGSDNDLQHGARCNPGLYKKYVELEKKIGHTMFMHKGKPISLEDKIGIKIID